MRIQLLFSGIAVTLLTACSTQETEYHESVPTGEEFFASFESPFAAETKVYVNEDFHLRWQADDRVSIFNKLTFNQQYSFTGETGDNAGGFRKTDTEEFVTGNAIPHIVSIYPYQETTRISESEIIAFNLPGEQDYAERSFGPRANTMVSVSSDNVLQYKNVGGYLVLSLFGDDVSVSSITLKGNGEEKLAGPASISMPMGGIPTVKMADNSVSEITLVCRTPIPLGEKEEACTEFWFVVPPMTFSKGFTVTIRNADGAFMDKSTSSPITISRNHVSKMSPIEVSLKRDDIRSITVQLSEAGTLADHLARVDCSKLLDIKITGEMDARDFNFLKWECTNIENVDLSEVSIVEYSGEYGTNEGYQYTYAADEIPMGAFFYWTTNYHRDATEGFSDEGMPSLKRVILPEGIRAIRRNAFARAYHLTEIYFPEGLETIDYVAFNIAFSLRILSFPSTLKEIGFWAFDNCNDLQEVHCKAITPPALNDSWGWVDDGDSVNGWFSEEQRQQRVVPVLYVPAESLSLYRQSDWALFFTDIRAENEIAYHIPESVDLGLSVEWATCNLGASEPEGTGYHFAWGETAPKEDFEWSNYKWSDEYGRAFTKYSHTGDGKVELDPEDDAAIMNLGAGWRMPTKEELIELKTQCTWVWTMQNGIAGNLVTGPNGNSIFIPATGCRVGKEVDLYGSHGVLWSTRLGSSATNCAYNLGFDQSITYFNDGGLRYHGHAIRPVKDKKGNSSLPVPGVIDLGLSVKWASFNLGASSPEEYGNYYAWGELEPKTNYSWETYKYGSSESTLTKYNHDPSCGIVDNKDILSPEDDVAHMKLGDRWRMPTNEEIVELLENCTWTTTKLNGVKGYLITSKIEGYTNQAIFLPKADSWTGTSSPVLGNRVCYWTSTRNPEKMDRAYYISDYFTPTVVSDPGGSRAHGLAIRPVYAE